MKTCKHYKEPVDGKYEDITPEILEGLESEETANLQILMIFIVII